MVGSFILNNCKKWKSILVKLLTYLRDLCLRSASTDRILTWFVVDSSKIRWTFNLRHAHPDSTSKPFPSSPLWRSSYMSQRSPNSRDHVNLNSLPLTSITWCNEQHLKLSCLRIYRPQQYIKVIQSKEKLRNLFNLH